MASFPPNRGEEGDEKPKPTESQDDGYETSNSGEAARRKASSAEGSPAAPRSPPPEPAYEPLLARFPEAPPYRYEPPPPQPQPEPEPYQHFPFPKYPEPYGYKREPEAPYDMSQQHALHYAAAHKRDETRTTASSASARTPTRSWRRRRCARCSASRRPTSPRTTTPTHTCTRTRIRTRTPTSSCSASPRSGAAKRRSKTRMENATHATLLTFDHHDCEERGGRKSRAQPLC
ncbi:unnamed protein product, partial [Iphiclides podalirius]